MLLSQSDKVDLCIKTTLSRQDIKKMYLKILQKKTILTNKLI